jgi:hypothetical protein
LITCAWIETSSAETASSQTISFGFDGERPGDADALPLPARELVRIAAHVVGREADRLEQLDDPRLELGPALRQLVDDQRLADDRADRHARIERGVRVLEDDLHVARQRAQLVLAGPGDVLALEPDLARGRLDQAQDAAAGVLLPQPDSPTTPSVSPACRSKLTPLTACTASTSRPSRPPLIGSA